MGNKGFKFNVRASDVKNRPPVVRTAAFAGIGRLRKVACLGGASTLKHAPFFDPTWELWGHASCRHVCKRDLDLLWDLHPPELWRNPKKKTWDPKYLTWLQGNRVPIMMQDVYPDIPSSVRYPIETIQTEFQMGYMTNHVAYMVALALTQGVTHIGIFGCDYETGGEYGPQRGSAEFWLGVAIGRGVQVCLPPGCDLLHKPHLEYGYESHPNGVRHPCYSFSIGPMKATVPKAGGGVADLTPSNTKGAEGLRDIGVAPDLFRRDTPVSLWPESQGANAHGNETARPTSRVRQHRGRSRHGRGTHDRG